MTNSLSFKINNNGILNLVQNKIDGVIHVNRLEKDKKYENITNISAGDMVMLINMYKYIKDNDIQNGLINPNGENKEEL